MIKFRDENQAREKECREHQETKQRNNTGWSRRCMRSRRQTRQRTESGVSQEHKEGERNRSRFRIRDDKDGLGDKFWSGC